MLFVVLTSFKQLAAGHSPCSLVVKKKATGLGCSGVKYERHKIHAKLFFFYLTRLAHAGLSMSSVDAKVHVCVFFFCVALFDLGTITCYGLLNSIFG